MKKWVRALVAASTVLLALSTASCQRVFTFSPFSFLQRDPASLPPEQQVAYAANALASGNINDMAAAYALIAELLAQDPNNPDLQLLAAELAIGGSGLGTLATSLDPNAGVDGFNAALATLNLELAAQAAAHVDAAAANGGAVSPSLYVNASMAILAGEASEAGGFDNIDWENPNPDVQKALDYAELGGLDIESFFNGGGE